MKLIAAQEAASSTQDSGHAGTNSNGGESMTSRQLLLARQGEHLGTATSMVSKLVVTALALWQLSFRGLIHLCLVQVALKIEINNQGAIRENHYDMDCADD